MSLPADRTELPGRRALLVLFLLGLLVRLAALAELSSGPWCSVLLGDARSYDDWAQRIAAGDAVGEGVFFQAPLYPYLLGVVYAVLGHRLLVVFVLQSVLGALTAVLVADGGARLFGRTAGLAAGAWTALYMPAIAYDLQIEKTSVALFLSALLLWIVAAAPAGISWKRALVTGALLGALTLLRENAAILVVPLAVLVARSGAARAPALGALVAGFVLALLPVALRNLAVGGAFVPTASNAGVNFYIGNGADADGLYRPLVAGRGHADYEREDAARIAESLAGRSLSPAEVSAFWFGQARREIAAEPGHFLGVLARKLAWLVDRHEIMDAVAVESFADGSVVLKLLAPVGFGLLLPLAAAGIVLARGRGPRAAFALQSALALALGIVAFFVNARFRLGLVPFLAPFAGLGLIRLVRRPRQPWAWLAFAGALVAAWWPRTSPGDPRATSLSNLASELLRRDDAPGAERWARAAIEADPGSAEAAYNLGIALRRQGRNAEAVPALESARKLEPAYTVDVLAELGAVRALAGDREGAAALLDQALELAPDHIAARRYREALEHESGRAPDAQRSE